MLKQTVSAAALAAILAFAIPGRPVSTAGSWQVDPKHSDAQLLTDATTNYGKTKLTFTIGFTRVNGTVKLDNSDPANSAFDFRMYPATSMAPPINEEGKVKAQWFANLANHTLVCFHSKGFTATGNGGLRTTGNLILTRVDRNVDVTPNEAYAGPVYGPPVIHRVSHPATFVFDFPDTAGKKAQKDGSILATGSTNVVGEDFPQLLKAVVGTYWPPVVQDMNCNNAADVNEAYAGQKCTGTMLQAPGLPDEPRTTVGEDFPAPSDFNSILGEKLNIVVHMRLAQVGAGAAAGN
jgi:polyisoprenoid-binding protein YceI